MSRRGRCDVGTKRQRLLSNLLGHLTINARQVADRRRQTPNAMKASCRELAAGQLGFEKAPRLAQRDTGIQKITRKIPIEGYAALLGTLLSDANALAYYGGAFAMRSTQEVGRRRWNDPDTNIEPVEKWA